MNRAANAVRLWKQNLSRRWRLALLALIQVLFYHPIQPIDCALQLGRKKISLGGVCAGKGLFLSAPNRLLVNPLENVARHLLVNRRQVLANDRFERKKAHLVLNLILVQGASSISSIASPSAQLCSA